MERPIAIGDAVDRFAPGANTLYGCVPRLLEPDDAEPVEQRAAELRAAGVPQALALRVASLGTMYAAFDIVEVAEQAGLDVESVAAVHFGLGNRLQLHWLRDRIFELPRDDRWRALARAALRDDLYGLHRALTAEVLRGWREGEEPGLLVERWIEHNPAAERCLQTLADIRVGRTFDMTTLPVAVREVRNLL
jgi:glutamate dehydrogenase